MGNEQILKKMEDIETAIQRLPERIFNQLQIFLIGYEIEKLNDEDSHALRDQLSQKISNLG